MQFDRLQRRELITLFGGAAAWPFAARAQQPAGEPPRVGILNPIQSENSDALLRGLRDAGYVDGQNMRLEARFYGSAIDRTAELARELVALRCNVIFSGGPYAIRAAMKATSTIPIVAVDLESDPVASGLVKSVARPGGNVTGFFLDIPELGGKQIQLLMEAVPTVARVAVVWDATTGTVQFRAAETASRPAGVVVQSLPIRRAEDINEAIARAVDERAHGLVVLTSPLIFLQRSQIAELALNARLPMIGLFNSFAKVGGLLAYGPNMRSLYVQAAGYVARILAGANPGLLPIQRPSKFELAVNLKTAKALGLTISEMFLVRADEVIE